MVPTVVAGSAGVITLAGYLIPVRPLTFIRDRLIAYAAIIAAFALVLGFINLLRVHLGQILRRKPSWLYSLTLLLSALASLVITSAGLLGRAPNDLDAWWFSNVLLPLQSGAAGLVALSLGMAGFRLMRSRRTPLTIFFLASALIVLLGTTPLPGTVGRQLVALRQWWMSTMALAGIRGLLIGVGLGTLVMGLRIISGVDRPHSST
jgi:hypothetical protein